MKPNRSRIEPEFGRWAATDTASAEKRDIRNLPRRRRCEGYNADGVVEANRCASLYLILSVLQFKSSCWYPIGRAAVTYKFTTTYYPNTYTCIHFNHITSTQSRASSATFVSSSERSSSLFISRNKLLPPPVKILQTDFRLLLVHLWHSTLKSILTPRRGLYPIYSTLSFPNWGE